MQPKTLEPRTGGKVFGVLPGKDFPWAVYGITASVIFFF